ncbi:MAG TPA: adenylosuccinate synthase [Chloroflexi bacterium]|mgnify:CR=1 FL=1|nr:adenylosuccinate synthase [Chloroflexota bacterium]
MAVTAVVGAQYGDEGKGRIIDFLAGNSELVVRFQGGDNAGHTVINDLGKFQLHLVPSGIFNPTSNNLIGTGVVVNPDSLLSEIEALEGSGIDTSRLFVSDRAHMLLPHHATLDNIEEKRRGDQSIGTTSRGIGPAYREKTARTGVRLGDLNHPNYLRMRLELQLDQVNTILSNAGESKVDLEDLWSHCMNWADKLGDRIVDPIPLMKDAIQNDRNVLLEGQLGGMKDLDWGTYPFVTSSNPLASFASIGAGIPHHYITNVIGVTKAYGTSVGAGPFPGELDNEIGKKLRDIGEEYGVTTGRPRRTGWYDSVAVNHTIWLNGMTSLAITKLDVLDEFDEIKICYAYKLPNGNIIDFVPDTPVLDTIEPMYETWSGWNVSTADVRSWSDLPIQARKYLDRIKDLSGLPISYVSVGAKREAMFAT